MSKIKRNVTLDFFKSLCRFDESETAETPCWIWRGCVNGESVPVMRYEGKVVTSRRVGFFLKFKRWPTGRKLYPVQCLRVDCCNPAHMVVVKNKQIPKLMSKHNQIASGMKLSVMQRRHPRNAKLTSEQAKDSRRRMLFDGVHPSVLAAEYGMHISSFKAIKANRSWREGILA